MVKIKTILTKRRAGIMIGQVGIGLMAFPWIHVFWNESNHDISFWKWFFGSPTIVYNDISFKKYVQLRIMCFVIQVTT